ncbi:MAG: lipid-A-disaccharide synthase-related protein [Oscillatoriaceae bacterium SKYG93]|nr:lipid-A-disaccharide synthase-related protein [Oscillatoriaceae bacterium SKYG93]MDW8455075.1 lipid-A-disaccharide synthase-related protein [Oscillatoriaceae cyanobacterium SKYGB_i_bin93]
MKLLCLSNGHGEDIIAVRILRELQRLPNPPELAALPLVGEGEAYAQLEGVSIIGKVKKMPSGGFIYMDGKQLLRDLKDGLLQLTFSQLKAVRAWAKKGGAILAVGDIVPLLFAWMSGAVYAFVGTAKSEYYIRDEAGMLPRRSLWERLEGWSGSVYLPWERWLMSRNRCKAVFPRDSLTAQVLQKFSIPVLDLGNPMMDELEVEKPEAIFYEPDREWRERQRSMVVTLLPGSRAPEAYRNWQKILQAVAGLCETFAERKLIFLAALAPSLSLSEFCSGLQFYGWQQNTNNLLIKETIFFQNLPAKLLNESTAKTFILGNSTLILTQHAFAECLQAGDIALAMAGTATEQFVGLGKPALAIPGSGPQFTPAFAEAQSRLLGPSLILVQQPQQIAAIVQQLLRDPDLLHLIEENGQRRMGFPGAARRIAACLMQRLGSGE